MITYKKVAELNRGDLDIEILKLTSFSDTMKCGVCQCSEKELYNINFYTMPGFIGCVGGTFCKKHMEDIFAIGSFDDDGSGKNVSGNTQKIQ